MSRYTLTFATLTILSAPAAAQLTTAQLAYPRAAALAGREGTVGYEVTLSKDGKVTGCRVTQSSGFADLDQQTCTQLQRSARFKPAIDADGKPIPSIYSSGLRWKIPNPAINPDGKPISSTYSSRLRW